MKNYLVESMNSYMGKLDETINLENNDKSLSLQEDLNSQLKEDINAPFIKIYKASPDMKAALNTIYNSDDVSDDWDYPVDELDYLLEEHPGESFVLKDDRLYEMSADINESLALKEDTNIRYNARKKNKLTESYHGSMADALFGSLDDDLEQSFENIIRTAIKSVFNASTNKNQTFKHLDDKKYCDDYTEYLDQIENESFSYDATCFENPWPANSPEGKLFYDTVKNQCGPLITFEIERYGDGRYAYFTLTDNVLDYFIKK